MQVFISHSHKDAGIYSALCIALDAAPIDRWKPRELSPSESLAEQLRQAIHDCQVCVFIVTRCSVASQWCLAELGAFWGAAKKVFLFMGESGLSDSDLPSQFRGSFWTSDAGTLIEKLSKEAKTQRLLIHERPANVYWLGHDLVRSIELIRAEPKNRKEIEQFLFQGLHHLSEIGVTDDNDKARRLIFRSIALTCNDDDLYERNRETICDLLRQAKDEIGERMKKLQPHFEVWADPDQKSKWKETARHMETDCT